jgi:hypothetical protein
MITEAQLKFVQLEKKKEEVKKYFEELATAIEEVKNEIGLNGMFQDGDGTVYQVVKPAGRFVDYNDLECLRTRRLGEVKGSLSLKKAREAGFILPEDN